MTYPVPMCYGLNELFDSDEERDHVWAAKMCAECPLFEACARYRDDLVAKGLPIVGTYAGQLFHGRKEPGVWPWCGTSMGARNHRKHGEFACDDCAAKQREYEAARKRQARAS